MNLPTIEELKQQVNVDHDDDDNLLLTYSSAAKTTIENYINRKLYEDSVPDDCSNGMVINNVIKVAILMLVAHWYDNREAVAVNSSAVVLPLAYQMLINPYRVIPL